ncbi:MAG: response regulator [Deltaproteobacteria bacterium]|nr:response regulator [Deltaproteobacteria bacterium]
MSLPIAKVILIDDEVGFLNIMKKRLESRDLDIQTAESGPEALEVMGKSPDLDVAILDVKMPGMDGIETLGEIRKHFPLIEVVMLTAHATVETAIDGMKKGAFDYLMKPCDIDKLIEIVRRAKVKKTAHEEKILQAHIQEITNRMGG